MILQVGCRGRVANVVVVNAELGVGSLRGIDEDGIASWRSSWLGERLDTWYQNVLWVTALHWGWNLLLKARLEGGSFNIYLRSCNLTCWNTSWSKRWITRTCASRWDIVLHKLFLQLCLLLSLLFYLFLTLLLLIAICVSIKINRRPLPC
jgi:hypothetical protein